MRWYRLLCRLSSVPPRRCNLRQYCQTKDRNLTSKNLAQSTGRLGPSGSLINIGQTRAVVPNDRQLHLRHKRETVLTHETRRDRVASSKRLNAVLCPRPAFFRFACPGHPGAIHASKFLGMPQAERLSLLPGPSPKRTREPSDVQLVPR